MSNTVKDLIQGDCWSLAESEAESGSFVIRYRTPVLQASEVANFDTLVRIVWAYSQEGSGAMPSSADSEAMQRFEDRLCEAAEHDHSAALTAVLTFDGARQWVWYTPEIKLFSERLNNTPQESDPYPIELDASHDPEWNYLRNEILLSVSTDEE